MATIKEYLDYAELAQAAYGFLGIGTPNIQELNYNKRADFSIIQAENFSERYKVLAVSTPHSNGFSATLAHSQCLRWECI